MPEDCIFCKIVKGDIPCYKVWEDKDHIAILDIFPNTPGMTLVIPREHQQSFVFDMEDKAYQEMMMAAKKVGSLLKKKLNPAWVCTVIEGLEVSHAHVKLYPVYEMSEERSEGTGDMSTYRGFVTTKAGTRAEDEVLAEIAEKIRD